MLDEPHPLPVSRADGSMTVHRTPLAPPDYSGNYGTAYDKSAVELKSQNKQDNQAAPHLQKLKERIQLTQ
jgi:hypothetical protein